MLRSSSFNLRWIFELYKAQEEPQVESAHLGIAIAEIYVCFKVVRFTIVVMYRYVCGYCRVGKRLTPYSGSIRTSVLGVTCCSSTAHITGGAQIQMRCS